MKKAYVLGVGMTTFGKRPDTSMEKMGVEAAGEALTDGELDIKQIEAMWCGHGWQGSGAGQRIMAAYGFSGIPVTNVENICASGSTAFREAYYAVATGRYDSCMALGVEKMTGKFKGAITPDAEDLEGELGLTFPAIYALRAQRYMHEYGLTSDGGLLGKGHPLGATGVAQIYELAKQLRNEAGKRQIAGVRIGLAHCRGGLVTGTEGAACAVTILRGV